MQGVAGVAWALTRQLKTSGCTGPLELLYMLLHLYKGWQVYQPILSDNHTIVTCFRHDQDPRYIKMKEVLYSITEKIENLVVTYLVGILEVPDASKMYELYCPCTAMVFFQNKYIMIDLGTISNNKMKCIVGGFLFTSQPPRFLK